jgi:hypothetical protein
MHRNKPLLRHRLPDAQLLQECGVTRRERVDSRVEALELRRRTLVRDQRDRKPAYGARDACADRTAANNDEILLLRVYNRARSVAN